jgi:hypothetical protein
VTLAGLPSVFLPGSEFRKKNSFSFVELVLFYLKQTFTQASLVHFVSNKKAQHCVLSFSFFVTPAGFKPATLRAEI